MADISDINSAQSVKIIGSSSSGVEQTPIQSTSNGGIHANLRDNSGTELATTTNPAIVAGNIANAAADSGNPVKAGAVYNSTAPTYTTGQRTDLQTDMRGSLYTQNEGRRRTYSAAAIFSAGAVPTDIFTITGANGVLTKIISLHINGIKTTSAHIDILVLKRSTANTGGTSVVVPAVPHDSSDAAASSTVQYYTANPTTGTLVGNVLTEKLFVSDNTGTISPTADSIMTAGDSFVTGKNIRLNSASEVLAVNLNGVTAAGNSFAITITWTEE